MAKGLFVELAMGHLVVLAILAWFWLILDILLFIDWRRGLLKRAHEVRCALRDHYLKSDLDPARWEPGGEGPAPHTGRPGGGPTSPSDGSPPPPPLRNGRPGLF